MLVKVQFLGTTNSRVTQNQEYILVGDAYVIDDNGELFAGGPYDNTAVWHLVSVVVVGEVQVHP